LVCKRLEYLLAKRLLGRPRQLKLPARPRCFRGERGI
jgi:hypothetical protein